MPESPPEVDTSRARIVVHNLYYAKPGQAEAVYQWRLHASNVRAQLGFPRGRVLRRVDDATEPKPWPQPDVIWECDYASLAEREQDARAVESTPAFQAVMRHMRTLIDHFERRIWRQSA